MNDKIKQLQEQATEDILGVKIVNHQRFAELIIRECVDIAEQTRYDGQVAAARIKFVFGVDQ
jgi:hypothetical protein